MLDWITDVLDNIFGGYEKLPDANWTKNNPHQSPQEHPANKSGVKE